MSDPWQYRLATVRDADSIAALVNSVYRGESGRRSWTTEAELIDGLRIDPTGVHEIIAHENACILVVFPDGEPEEIVACVELRHAGSAGTYLGMLSVSASAQKAGLGSFLLQTAETFARLRFHSPRMFMRVLGCREELLHWYFARGYVRTGQREEYPVDNPRFGRPKVSGLYFDILAKALGPG